MRKFINCFFLFAMTQVASSAVLSKNVNDSLLTSLAQSSEDTIRVNILARLCFEFIDSDADKAIAYAKEGLKLAAKLNYEKGMASCYGNIGWAFYSKGNYKEAIDNHLKSLKINERIGDKKGVARNLASIGGVYRMQGDYERAIDYETKGLKIDLERGDKNDIASDYANIGNIYIDKHEYEIAIEYELKALKVFEELSDMENASIVINNIGSLYYNKGDYKQALNYFKRSLNISKETGEKNSIATALNNVAIIYQDMGNYKEAIECLDQSLAIAKELKANDIIMHNYLNLADIYSTKNDYKKAFEYSQLYSAIRDTIYNSEVGNQIQELSVKYETEKKDAENKVLRVESERQKIINIAVTVGLLLVGILAILIFRSYRQKKKAYSLLGKQNAEIRMQKSIIEEKNIIVEERNKDITDSIKYAKRLQNAILKPEKKLTDLFDDGFIFFRPKDIVSGDFYWFEKFGDLRLVAAADCTGHGVPGAFMSIIGCNLLSQSVIEQGITNPSSILNAVNRGILKVLPQRGEEASVKDGMDIALCVFNPEKMVVEYAGAFNPMWLVQDGKLIEYKADKFPIGAFVDNELRNFTNYEVPVRKGDMVYIFSDGYSDQFGGKDGKKFKYKSLKQLILENHSKPGQAQREIFEQTLENWMGKLDQVDDVLLIGVRI